MFEEEGSGGKVERTERSHAHPDPLPGREREERADALDGDTVDPRRPRSAVLGRHDVHCGVGSHRVKLLVLGIPGTVRAHRPDRSRSVGEALEPLGEALEPIQSANVYPDADLRSLGDGLSMGTHIEYSSINAAEMNSPTRVLMLQSFV
jgi:hypothetical protein